MVRESFDQIEEIKNLGRTNVAKAKKHEEREGQRLRNGSTSRADQTVVENGRSYETADE